MAKPRSGGDDAVIDQATKWFALLRSDAATDDDRRAFEAWLSADPRHAAAYENTLSIWEDVGALDDLKDLVSVGDLEPELAPQLKPEAGAGAGYRRGPSRRLVAFGALAAAIFLAVILPAIMYMQPAWLLPHVHATRTAETARIELPDGSLAELAPESRLRVAYSNAERRIHLQGGEGYFDVRKGDARPFIVASGTTQVRVTGTKFNVRQGPAGVTVSVAEGAVEVERRAPAGSVDGRGAMLERLVAGEQVVAPVDGARLGDIVEAPPASIATWRAGRLSYKGDPLREFIADANRYTDVKIVADERLLDLPLIASLRTDQIDATIDSLPEILPLQVDRSRRDRVMLRPAPEETP
ncbi:DUF4880 domain-containing protein [Parvularcula flava]|uniref:DUF4880 domain-containing protein n=1 Tax=Aquisalinus luteolus TaxID=1566827 RepID=A0A8J3A0W9_9PROT|nr:FecR domain-containing protein [Aquisalinus luteolus]NHK27166.1 DUF4880 domain-containing protein [Aquisalinus luteolus]GGH94597.1 peptide ABC transporter substrate-binding protein [Aquisalinus luteolus]